MSKKIFISYKYADDSVYQNSKLDKIEINNSNAKVVTPRSYLNYLSELLADYAIQKWENDKEDLSNFKDSTIESKLKDKIYDSSLTIVLISPKMKEWIPWEISYSLKEITRNDRTSHTNAMIALVLPDKNGEYEYCIKKENCSNTLLFSDDFCFEIIGDNFFNKKEPIKQKCSKCGKNHYVGYENHYFVYATWSDFCKNPQKYIDRAKNNQDNLDDYNIRKNV